MKFRFIKRNEIVIDKDQHDHELEMAYKKGQESSLRIDTHASAIGLNLLVLADRERARAEEIHRLNQLWEGGSL